MGLCPGHAAAKAQPWGRASPRKVSTGGAESERLEGLDAWLDPAGSSSVSRASPSSTLLPRGGTARTTQRKVRGPHPAVDTLVPSGVWCQDETPGKGVVRLLSGVRVGTAGRARPGLCLRGGTGRDSLELYLPGSRLAASFAVFSWQRASFLGHTRSKKPRLNHAGAHLSRLARGPLCPASARWQTTTSPPGTFPREVQEMQI